MADRITRLKHLFWRSGFGMSPDEWQALKDVDPVDLVPDMIRTAQKAATRDITVQYEEEVFTTNVKKMEKEASKPLRRMRRLLGYEVITEWTKRMSSDQESALLEKMCLFWHGHFGCISQSNDWAQNQLSTIRKYAIGNFRDLVKAISRDAAMIKFLNLKQNKRSSPNENYARELLELFTLGRSNYSERDIKEAARAFTGWSADEEGNFWFRESVHDFGEKTFLGKTGTWNGDDVIDIILEQKQCARFIATEVYRYFVHPEPVEQHIDRLADRFYSADYDIAILMQELFSSDWFYDDYNIGVNIKSPVELTAGMMRSLNVTFGGVRQLPFLQVAMGQELFHPPNVSGWPSGKEWITSTSIMLRTNLINYMLRELPLALNLPEEPEREAFEKHKDRLESTTVDFQPLQAACKDVPEDKLLAYLTEYFIVSPVTINENVVNDLLARSRGDKVRGITQILLTLPEYQLC